MVEMFVIEIVFDYMYRFKVKKNLVGHGHGFEPK